MTVTRIARKYLYIERYGREEGFSLGDGHSRDDSFALVMTQEMLDLETRGKTARETLKAHGVNLDFGCNLTTEQLEALANAAKTFPRKNCP